MNYLSVITGCSIVIGFLSIAMPTLTKNKLKFLNDFFIGLAVTCAIVLILCFISFAGSGIAELIDFIFRG